MEVLDFIINGGETVRFHTWPVLRPQRVDSHSFHVAMLCALIGQSADISDGVGLSLPLIMAALTHDLAEHKLGDLPAPTKRAMGKMESGLSFRAEWGMLETQLLMEQALDWEAMLEPRQLHWLKLADAMEGALYCTRERMMGNRLMATPFGNFRKYIREEMWENEEEIVREIVSYIDDMWEQAND